MMDLRPGDYFCVRTQSWMASAILKAQKLKALDGESTYNHAGIIVAPDGTTFESLRKIGHSAIQSYIGCPVLIVRHRDMTFDRFKAGYEGIRKWDGCVYPFWRLLLHAAGLAHFLHPVGIPVSRSSASLAQASGLPGLSRTAFLRLSRAPLMSKWAC